MDNLYKRIVSHLYMTSSSIDNIGKILLNKNLILNMRLIINLY